MIKCQTVMVKFKDKNLPAQEINNRGCTGATFLEVNRDDRFVVIMYRNDAGLGMKQIAFNLDDIKEYACEGVNEVVSLKTSLTAKVLTHHLGYVE